MNASISWAGATIKPSVGIHHEPRPGRGDDEPAAHAARRRSFRLHRLRAAPTYRWPTSPTSSNKGGPDGGEQERKLAPSSSSSSSNRLGGIHLALETLEPLSACPPALPGSRRARGGVRGRARARATVTLSSDEEFVMWTCLYHRTARACSVLCPRPHTVVCGLSLTLYHCLKEHRARCHLLSW